jgi:hypothetical protein
MYVADEMEQRVPVLNVPGALTAQMHLRRFGSKNIHPDVRDLIWRRPAIPAPISPCPGDIDTVSSNAAELK